MMRPVAGRAHAVEVASHTPFLAEATAMFRERLLRLHPVEAGAVAFLELGPGRALAEMAASAYPAIPARSIE